MTEPTPRCPSWASNQGWPTPEPGEGFRAYWKRVGASDDVVDWSLDLHFRGAEDCANERMATWLRLYRPKLMLAEIDRLCFTNGIPVHKVGVARLEGWN